ncbi:hypothetical protein JIQ42_01587 [Leishmania sp. Namibia]|uniref:hypothetical protein n=1 Tax=Leishmania sp. Namibia TaxID=2802991 RepID=UPI001B6B0DEF|nr:hypothetical protein JIQ42_01587 [Leishmania sp. Namibia]
MELSFPSHPPTREPSLRAREPSVANTHHQKASMPRDFCSVGRAVAETAAPEPVECVSATVAEAFMCTDATTVSMMKAPLERVQRTPYLAMGQENAVASTVSIVSNRKSARSPRPSQVTGLCFTTDEAAVVTPPHADGGLQARANAPICGTRGSATNSTDRSLTEMALSTVLRPSRDSICEPERLSLFSTVADSDIGMDRGSPTASSFQHTRKGEQWCAVVAAHTDAVHRLATMDVTFDCGVTTDELSHFTLIATEAAGLQIRFQLLTLGDAQREITLRRRLSECEFRRLTEHYQNFVTASMSSLPADEGSIKSAPCNLQDDDHPVERVIETAPNSHRRASEDRRQLVVEFESTLEDMRSIQCQ